MLLLLVMPSLALLLLLLHLRQMPRSMAGRGAQTRPLNLTAQLIAYLPVSALLLLLVMLPAVLLLLLHLILRPRNMA
jgi:hypothetical protein